MRPSSFRLTLVLGLPGSGKSTFVDVNLAHQWAGDQLIRFDAIRQAMGQNYCPNTEPLVNAVACIMARIAFTEGRGVVVDESITVPGVAMDLVGIAREFEAGVEIVHLSTPVHECRAKRVPSYMSEAEFERKVCEWGAHGKQILELADKTVCLTPGAGMLIKLGERHLAV